MDKEFMRTTNERLNRLEDWAQQMGPPYLPPFGKPVGKPRSLDDVTAPARDITKDRKGPETFVDLDKPVGTEDVKPYHMLYRNHKGEVGARHVYPLAVWHGVTVHHYMPQWFLRAWCLDRKAVRDFAMNDILGG